jgi:phage head maturation protease
MLTRAYDATVSDVDREKRTIVSTINTDALDRYKTVIVPEGGRFDNYRKNPVVLCNHNHDALPIGKNLWIKGQKRKLVAKTQFLPSGKDDLADKVFDLYAEGFLNAWSISFDEIDAGPPTPDEIRKRPELVQCRCVYRVWDLLEYSCVTVPGNQECVRKAAERGLSLPGWPAVEPEPPADPLAGLPPLHGRTVAQVQAALVRQVRAEFFANPEQLRRDIFDLAKGQV